MDNGEWKLRPASLTAPANHVRSGSDPFHVVMSETYGTPLTVEFDDPFRPSAATELVVVTLGTMSPKVIEAVRSAKSTAFAGFL